jgi:RNA polymerase sigma factor FliA
MNSLPCQTTQQAVVSEAASKSPLGPREANSHSQRPSVLDFIAQREGRHGLIAEEGDAKVGTETAHRAAAKERNQMALEHLHLVRSVARRIREHLPPHVSVDDLYGAGLVGLLDAVDKFDAARHVEFAPYARIRIRGAILDSLREQDWSPRVLRRKARAIDEAIHKLTTQLGRSVDDAEIARELHIDLESYQKLARELDGLQLEPIYPEGDNDSPQSRTTHLATQAEDDPLSHCLRTELRNQLAAAMEELSEQERQVMECFYYKEMPMKEIAFTMGVLQPRISQIHSAALRHLRARFACSSGTASGESKDKREPVSRFANLRP